MYAETEHMEQVPLNPNLPPHPYMIRNIIKIGTFAIPGLNFIVIVVLGGFYFGALMSGVWQTALDSFLRLRFTSATY